MRGKRVVLIGGGLIVLYWLLESATHFFLIRESLANSLFPLDTHGMWERALVVVLLSVFTFHAYRAVSKRERIEAQLRVLSHRLIEAQEKERHMIARELHDQTGQSLVVLNMLLSKIKAHLSDAGSAYMKEAMEVMQEIKSQVRNMSYSLHPSMLEDLGLVPTLLWYFEDFRKRTGLDVDFKHSGFESKLAADINITAYRIIQEALTNVVKYAGVNKVRVTVLNNGATVTVKVMDRGKGFEPDRLPPTSSGLRGIRERAFLLGGKVKVISAPDKGTSVIAELPVKIMKGKDGAKNPD